MKQTENYQLNQWEKTDRIMMEDFNSDNQKIEAALNGLRQIIISGDLLLARFNQIDQKIKDLDQRVTALEQN